jgi:hypothetical protein
MNVAERNRNPFLRTSTGGRVLSALMLPQFMIVPPAGFGVLTTTGRRSGKTRRKCVRAIRRGDKVCMMWRRGRPTRSKIRELHRRWFDQGFPLVVELSSSLA